MRPRGLAIPLSLLALASCIPREAERVPPVSRRGPPVGPVAAETQQCFADLHRDDVAFRSLPDRDYGNGCTALGAVQLLDIGTPVTNLGAMTCPLAHRFEQWVRDAVQPAARVWLGSRVVKIESFGT